MRLFLCVFQLLIVAVFCAAQSIPLPIVSSKRLTSAGGGGGNTNLVFQNFTNTGYMTEPNGALWTLDGAATLNASGGIGAYEGTYFAQVGATTSDGIDLNFSPTNQCTLEFWAYFPTTADHAGFVTIGNTAFSLNYTLLISGGGNVRVTQNGGIITAVSVGFITINTWMHFKFTYIKNSSGSVVARVGFSLTDSVPTSGDDTAAITTGTSSFDASRVYFQGRAVEVMSYDKVRVW